MTFPELISAVSKETGLTPQDARASVTAVFEIIKRTMANKDMIRVDRFGTFLVRETSKRAGRDPNTGEETMSSSSTPAFRADIALMDAVNYKDK